MIGIEACVTSGMVLMTASACENMLVRKVISSLLFSLTSSHLERLLPRTSQYGWHQPTRPVLKPSWRAAENTLGWLLQPTALVSPANVIIISSARTGLTLAISRPV